VLCCGNIIEGSGHSQVFLSMIVLVTQAPAASAHTPPLAQPTEAAAVFCGLQQTVSQSVCRASSVGQHRVKMY